MLLRPTTVPVPPLIIPSSLPLFHLTTVPPSGVYSPFRTPSTTSHLPGLQATVANRCCCCHAPSAPGPGRSRGQCSRCPAASPQWSPCVCLRAVVGVGEGEAGRSRAKQHKWVILGQCSPGHGVKLLGRLPCVLKVQVSIPARRMVPFFGAMALSLSVLLSGLCPCGASVRGRGFGHFASTKCHPV